MHIIIFQKQKVNLGALLDQVGLSFRSISARIAHSRVKYQKIFLSDHLYSLITDCVRSRLSECFFVCMLYFVSFLLVYSTAVTIHIFLNYPECAVDLIWSQGQIAFYSTDLSARPPFSSCLPLGPLISTVEMWELKGISGREPCIIHVNICRFKLTVP